MEQAAGGFGRLWTYFGLLFLFLLEATLPACANTSLTVCAGDGMRRTRKAVDSCACRPVVLSPAPACTSQWLTSLNLPGPMVNHHGMAWSPANDTTVSGVHCNISDFHLLPGYVLHIQPWNGNRGGRLVIQAQGDITVDGFLDGVGRGYRGGLSFSNGTAGFAGEGYQSQAFMQTPAVSDGGGGGGKDRVTISAQLVGRPGAGGGYGTPGSQGQAGRSSVFSTPGK